MRLRACPVHAKAESVLLDGVLQRMCQKCNRFEPLSVFSGAQRTCRVRLEAHNHSRRLASRPGSASKAAKSQQAGDQPRSADADRSSAGPDGSNESPPNPTSSLHDALDSAYELFREGSAAAGAPVEGVTALLPLSSVSDLFDLPGGNTAGAPLLQPFVQPSIAQPSSVTIKLHDSSPLAFGPGVGEFTRASIIMPGAQTVQFQAFIHPGCVQITVDALLAGDSPLPESPHALLEALLALEGSAGRVFTSDSLITLRMSERPGVAVARHGTVATPATAAPPAPALPVPSILALLLPLGDSQLDADHRSIMFPAADCPQGDVRVRLNGQYVSVTVEQVEGNVLRLTLPPLHLLSQGVLLVERCGSAADAAPGPARPVLLCTSPAVVAEVNTATSTQAAGEPRAALELALRLLGATLGDRAAGVEAASVRPLAVAACLRLGWVATTELLLSQAPDDQCWALPWSDTLLHEAVATGNAELVTLVASTSLVHPGVGTASSSGRGRRTPLHTALAITDAGAAASVLQALTADGELQAVAAAAWILCQDAHGHTPRRFAAERIALHDDASMASTQQLRSVARLLTRLGDRADSVAQLACDAVQQRLGVFHHAALSEEAQRILQRSQLHSPQLISAACAMLQLAATLSEENVTRAAQRAARELEAAMSGSHFGRPVMPPAVERASWLMNASSLRTLTCVQSTLLLLCHSRRFLAGLTWATPAEIVSGVTASKELPWQLWLRCPHVGCVPEWDIANLIRWFHMLTLIPYNLWITAKPERRTIAPPGLRAATAYLLFLGAILDTIIIARFSYSPLMEQTVGTRHVYMPAKGAVSMIAATTIGHWNMGGSTPLECYIPIYLLRAAMPFISRYLVPNIWFICVNPAWDFAHAAVCIMFAIRSIQVRRKWLQSAIQQAAKGKAKIE